jgi:phage shock protein A
MAVSTTRLAALAAVLAAVLLASGCGGGGGSSSSDTKPAEDWANSVCSAITTWTSSVRQTGNDLRSGSVNKDSLNKAVNDFESSTKQLASDLKGLGRPDTSSGQKAQASVEKLANEIQSDANKIKSEIKGASGIAGYQKALANVGATLQQMGQQVTSTFSELGNLDAKHELESAFKKADKCSTLVKQSG